MLEYACFKERMNCQTVCGKMTEVYKYVSFTQFFDALHLYYVYHHEITLLLIIETLFCHVC